MKCLRFYAIISLIGALEMAPVWAADSYKSSGGIAAYLGVIPAEIVRGHSPEHPEKSMHGGVPRGSRQYHVVIAVFDSATGERITDAERR